MTDSNPYPPVKSVECPPPDPEETRRLFANLESRPAWSAYGKKPGSPIVPPRSPRPTDEDGDREEEPTPLPVAEIPLAQAEEYGLRSHMPAWSGVMCDRCSNEMVRTGTCYSCPGCGDTTGCG